MKTLKSIIIAVATILAGAAQAQLHYVISNNAVTITRSFVSNTFVVPDTIEGKPVVAIAPQAFFYCDSLTNITLGKYVQNIGYSAFETCWNLQTVHMPASVTNIAVDAFCECFALQDVYCAGNAPACHPLAFACVSGAVVHYMPTAHGWSDNLGGQATAMQYLIKMHTTDEHYYIEMLGPPSVVVLEWSTNMTDWYDLGHFSLPMEGARLVSATSDPVRVRVFRLRKW